MKKIIRFIIFWAVFPALLFFHVINEMFSLIELFMDWLSYPDDFYFDVVKKNFKKRSKVLDKYAWDWGLFR